MNNMKNLRPSLKFRFLAIQLSYQLAIFGINLPIEVSTCQLRYQLAIQLRYQLAN